LLLLPDGTLLVAGARRRPEGRALGGELVLPPTDMLLARLDATSGALDPTFGSGGLVVTSLGGWEDRAFALVRMPDGRLAAGGVYDPNGVFGYEGDFGLTRYLPDGRLDPSFGGKCTWEEKPLTRPMM
jgi:hypothetical protein